MMRLNNVKLIIGASTVALIALIFFQVRWLIQAKDLIETDFEQKVRMALCYAVESLEKEGNTYQYGSPLSASVCKSNEDNAALIDILYGQKKEENQALQHALSAALAFYGIDMKYEMNVWDSGKMACELMGCGNDEAYCCPLSPFQKESESSLMLNVQFPNKTKYVLARMGFMVISSILILLFISVVFILANYTLIRQKRISELNIDFFNNMAHEFRTPLTNISLANKLLVKNRQDLKDNHYLEIVKRENNKLLQQIERVLYLAKLENENYQLQKTPIFLDDLIREVVADMDMQIKEREVNIEVEVEIAEEGDSKSWQIIGDRLHLGNAFRNLIDNALKYSDTGTDIVIRLEKKEKGLIVSFKDNGMGIPKSEQVYIFDKFSRISTQNVHNQKGFGLGLSYVKMIVERHNGFVEVMSDLQKGCRFDLFFPV